MGLMNRGRNTAKSEQNLDINGTTSQLNFPQPDYHRRHTPVAPLAQREREKKNTTINKQTKKKKEKKKRQLDADSSNKDMSDTD